LETEMEMALVHEAGRGARARPRAVRAATDRDVFGRMPELIRQG
jgi:hypothetical protein